MTVGGICVVRNCEQWVRYSLESIKSFVDTFVVIDNLSTDRTPVEIARTGIPFETKDGTVADLRNYAADKTGCDWIWWIDGDEVWCNAEAKKVVEAIKFFDSKKDVSILEFKQHRFVEDRVKMESPKVVGTMPRVYRHADVRMWGKSFPVAMDALARSEEHLEVVHGAYHTEVRVNQPYIRLVDAMFYHYAECNTLLDRCRKWYGYIKGSGSLAPFADMEKQVWGIDTPYSTFVQKQPEVFNV